MRAALASYGRLLRQASRGGSTPVDLSGVPVDDVTLLGAPVRRVWTLEQRWFALLG